ncbi:MAG: hypothetical protein KDE52_04565, partial [Calditrichaeota bacterium]|nr:hypothetical protein [Calditrichota bacterium]
CAEICDTVSSRIAANITKKYRIIFSPKNGLFYKLNHPQAVLFSGASNIRHGIFCNLSKILVEIKKGTLTVPFCEHLILKC